jgi:hypothetical protein
MNNITASCRNIKMIISARDYEVHHGTYSAGVEIEMHRILFPESASE